MSPALAPGDRVVADVHPLSSPRRGELWVFRIPPERNLAVKRVIGLPGETVEVASGRVLVDGRPLAEPYVAVPASNAVPPTKLKSGEYYLLGDNRRASHDSHVWGPLPAERLVGRVRFRIWPTRRVAGL
jgi:signal peptidase I